MANATPIPFERIQGWLFDLDGTLMDTDDQAVDSLSNRLRWLGLSRSRELARRIVMAGETPLNAGISVVDALGLDSLIYWLRKRLGHTASPTFRLIQGVEPLLAHLTKQARLAIVSTRSQDDAHAFLRQHDLVDMFTLVVTQETTRRLKPHPEPVLYTATKMGLPLEACVMVGDTPVDVRSARRAGAWAVGVLCGFGEPGELRRAGAHLVLPSTADLLRMVVTSPRQS